MIHEALPEPAPEQYELHERIRLELPRRDFLKTLGGSILVFAFAEGIFGQESGGGRRRGRPERPQEISAWLQIAEDGSVTAYTGKVEVGQNARTSLTQVVAEELRVPLETITLVMGDTALTPYDAGTFGSRTTPDMAPQLRRVAATAREILIDRAAGQWKRDRAGLAAREGKIVGGKDEIGYGALTKGQKLAQTASPDAPLTPPGEWNVLGKSVPKVDGRASVTGRHKYTCDQKIEDMLYGAVLRPAWYGADLISADAAEAARRPGVIVIHEEGFLGVAAPTEFEARAALKAVRAEWSKPEPISDEHLFERLVAGGRDRGRDSARNGSIAEGLEQADVRLKQTYRVAYIAHAPLEPRAALARWDDGHLKVWTGTQRPFGVRSELASAFNLPEEKVHVIVPDTGSGYGGKHTGEAAIEAARLAHRAGKPVKLVWSREEEFNWAYFRPAGVIEIASGARKDGTLTAWDFHNYNSGASGIRMPYEAPHQLIQFHSADSPLRQGSYRALASTANNFARECHMDELAHELKIDPLGFRLQNCRNDRFRTVLQAAAEKFGWGRQAGKGRGFGIAAGTEKGSYIATCVEVAVDPEGGVRVTRIVAAFECGPILNPKHLHGQVEGSIVMGLGGALFEAIQFRNGQITNGRFSEYRVPRFSDVPPIEVVLLNRTDLDFIGAGETPIIGVAPAIAGAIFAATGRRLRSLPLVPGGLPEAEA